MHSHHEGHGSNPTVCGEMAAWDYGMAMCRPLAMAGMPQRQLMIHGQAFLTQSWLSGPRGHDAFAVPNMVMVDAGSSVGDRHYFNVELMATVERWTFPRDGYPELLQVGESHDDETPYLDAQHPHSSPIMGLTVSDTIRLGEGTDHAKIWAAPRGEAGDGPVAFMHRASAQYIPDAPLGHHIGQDVGHIAGSVVGGSLTLGGSTLSVSTFRGVEPQPEKVDLPTGKPDSYSVRMIQQFGPRVYAMASAAYVKQPEPHDPDLDHIWRYSASLYLRSEQTSGWRWDNTLIWGLNNFYDHAAALNSFLDEILIQRDRQHIWARLEVLQRTPNELQVAVSDSPDRGRWVQAVTVGYAFDVWQGEGFSLGLGSSLTRDFVPAEFRRAYGTDPMAARVFLRLGGMRMW